MIARIALGAGLLVIVLLAVVGQRLMNDADDRGRDDGADDLPAADCPPQPRRAAAQRAQRVFTAEHVRSDADAAWFSGIGAVASRDARRMVTRMADAGVPVGPVPPADWRRGWALHVMVDPGGDAPELPGCVGRTPVVYTGNGPFRGG